MFNFSLKDLCIQWIILTTTIYKRYLEPWNNIAFEFKYLNNVQIQKLFFHCEEHSPHWTICNHYRPNDDDGYYWKMKLPTIIEKGEGVIYINWFCWPINSSQLLLSKKKKKNKKKTKKNEKRLYLNTMKFIV